MWVWGETGWDVVLSEAVERDSGVEGNCPARAGWEIVAIDVLVAGVVIDI